MQVRATSLVDEDFEEASHSAGTSVRKHLDFLFSGRLYALQLLRSRLRMILAGERAIDQVNKLHEARGLAVARMAHVHGKLRVDVRGITAEDNNAVGEDHCFFDVVGDDEDRAGR